MYILPQFKKNETLSTGLKDPSKNWFPHQHSTKGLSCRFVILTFETGSPIILDNFFCYDTSIFPFFSINKY